MILNEIEKKYNFNYPTLYKQLHEDGMLEMGEYGPKWYETVYPKLKDNPPLFLNTTEDFELLPTQDIEEEIIRITDPEDYRKIKPEFKFIPFGTSGAGDHYCFYLNEQVGDDIPIVLVWHDMNQVDYLAKNLQDYIFKILLNDMSGQLIQDLQDRDSDDEVSSKIKNNLKTHLRYLPEQQVKNLEDIASRNFIDYEIEWNRNKNSHRGLLTDIEFNTIIASTIPFEKTDTNFEYADE